MAETQRSEHEAVAAARRMDWTQAALTQTPCFWIGEDGRFCGRAHSWAGHEFSVQFTAHHRYVSFAELIESLTASPRATEAMVAVDEWRCVDKNNRTMQSFETEIAATGQPTCAFVDMLDRRLAELAPHRIVRVHLETIPTETSA